MRATINYSLIFLAFCAAQANAVILLGKDNSANQSNPGTGVPWDSVGRLSNLDGSIVGGSGIYLGNGYILTANHVGPFASVTFDGSTFYTHDGVPPIQVAANVDMKILRLTTMPTVAAVTLLTAPSELVAPATLVGWGVGRNPASSVGATVVPWDLDKNTIAKRWGLNAPKAIGNFGYQSGSYQGLITYLGSNSAVPAGLGNDEAAATLLDSGSGLFQQILGTWYLIGLTTGVDTYGTSTFGNDQPIDPNGDANYFARISSYDTQINALIPEPSSLLLTSPALLLLLRRRRCETRH